jgi:hypothetical protein
MTTKLAVCFLLIFGELAFGGTFALAIPPFFEVERGFYKSSATVYLVSALLTATGLGVLAIRGGGDGPAPAVGRIWLLCALWLLFCLLFGFYLFTLWTDLGLLRARVFSLALAAGMIAVVANMLWLKPASFGFVAALAYAVTGLTSSVVLGLVTGAMMFGHWYLIDVKMPVTHLKNFIRLLLVALAIDVAALALGLLVLAFAGGDAARFALASLFGSNATLLTLRMIFGPVTTAALAWMCWQTLKIPQTMAATGLLYIAVMSVLVGEMLGRFILFRTALPL